MRNRLGGEKWSGAKWKHGSNPAENQHHRRFIASWETREPQSSRCHITLAGRWYRRSQLVLRSQRTVAKRRRGECQQAHSPFHARRHQSGNRITVRSQPTRPPPERSTSKVPRLQDADRGIHGSFARSGMIPYPQYRHDALNRLNALRRTFWRREARLLLAARHYGQVFPVAGVYPSRWKAGFSG